MNTSATRERKKRKYAYKGYSGVDPDIWSLGKDYEEGHNIIPSEIKSDLKKISKRINVIPETGLYVDNKTGTVLSYSGLKEKISSEDMSIKMEDFFTK